MENSRQIEKKAVAVAAGFCLFLLGYMEMMAVCDDHISRINGLGVHYLTDIFKALGFLSFPLIACVMGKKRRHRLALYADTAVMLASISLLLYAKQSMMITVAALLFTLAYGYLGGYSYYRLSLALGRSENRGKVIGAACGGAVLIQYVISILISSRYIIFVAAMAFIISTVIYTYFDQPISEKTEPDEENAGTGRFFVTSSTHHRFILICTILLIIAMISVRTDIIFFELNYNGQLNFYSYTRLFLAVGYVIMGYAADLVKKNYFPIAVVAGILMTSVHMMLPLFSASYGNAFLSIYYISTAVYIFFYTYAFVSLAADTKYPELTAGFGRVLADLSEFLFYNLAVFFSHHFIRVSDLYYYGGYFVFLTVFVIVVFMNLPGLDFRTMKQTAITPQGEAVDVSRIDPDVFLDRYDLSPRERKIASLLIQSDEPMKVIAAEIGITERSLYRYSKKIYEKTESENRTALIKKYFSM
ncbi:MAG: hypothetical protein K6E18_08005 [Lachnospiraceae bacterium]|nr:hypothetical protein [Lachnospiraceae bacterium]